MSSKKAKGNSERKQERVVPAYEMQMTPEDMRRNTVIGASIVVTILVVIAVVIGVVMWQRHDSSKKSESVKQSSAEVMKTAAKPDGYVTDDGAIQWTKDGIVKGKLPAKWDDTAKVDVYLDPICPGCSSVDRLLTPYYEKYLESGDIVLRIHPMSFLTNYSTDDYSGRAANAILRSLDANPDKTFAFITYLMSEGVQPKEGPGYQPVSDEEIQQFAIDSGYTKAEVKDIMDRKYDKWLRASTDYIANRDDLKNEEGKFATPLVTVNGQKLSFDRTNADTIKQFERLVAKNDSNQK